MMHLVLHLLSGTSCRILLLMETKRDILVRHRNLRIIGIWIVTKAIRVDEVKMEQPVGEKKPKRV